MFITLFYEMQTKPMTDDMATINDKQGIWLATGLCVLIFALAGCRPAEPETAVNLPYADEYPGVGYGSREPQGSIGALARRVAAGEPDFDFHVSRGYLDSILQELAIDPSTQVLVFSRTSLQTRYIHPTTPRAIYFNDEDYVAFVPDSPSLELASYDPELGQVFYTLRQEPASAPAMERQFNVCLRCHDTYGLLGDGVPRFLLGSGYIGTDGELVSHEAWILTGQDTPFSSRWGGWYVTGRHGDQGHLGNIVVERAEDLQDLESLRVGNVAELSELLDTSRYLTGYSDIAALMVLEHQVEIQNLISRLRFEADSAAGEPLNSYVDALLESMLMVNEIALTDTIAGSSGFAEYFEALGPFDSAGRSLRQLDLQTRLFRYPLSYLIYSDAFQGLPPEARDMVYVRLREVLSGASELIGLDDLPLSDRAEISAILRETLPAVFAL